MKDTDQDLGSATVRPDAVSYSEQIFNGVLQVIREAGGSARRQQIIDEVQKFPTLTPFNKDDPYGRLRNKLAYNTSWALSYLKAHGILENPKVGVWSLTPKGRQTNKVDPKDIRVFDPDPRKSEAADPNEKTGVQSLAATSGASNYEEDNNTEEEMKWKQELLNLLQSMPPDAFERLCSKLLIESGWTNVKVTGKSGDGGIDGRGILEIGGFVRVPAFFQCKRYKGNVPAREVRDFFGALDGRTHFGTIITTGDFTADAVVEAARERTKYVTLINGDELVEKMKELELGIHEKTVIDSSFFAKV